MRNTDLRVHVSHLNRAFAHVIIRSRGGELTGVSGVEADVAAKKVYVTSNGATSKEAMLDALLKWSAASGKSVELATA